MASLAGYAAARLTHPTRLKPSASRVRSYSPAENGKSARRRFLRSSHEPYGNSSTSSSTTGGIRSSRVSFSQTRQMLAIYTDE